MNKIHCQICHGDGEHLCSGMPTACPVGGHISPEINQRINNLEQEIKQIRYKMGIVNKKLDPDDHFYD